MSVVVVGYKKGNREARVKAATATRGYKVTMKITGRIVGVAYLPLKAQALTLARQWASIASGN